VVAATLERAPVRLRIVPRQVGHVFEQPGRPGFDVELINDTDQPRNVQLQLTWKHYFGATAAQRAKTGQLAPRQTMPVGVETDLPQRDHYDLTLRLSDERGLIASRNTSAVLLAPDERRAEADSPFGIWCFWGTHGFPNYSYPRMPDEAMLEYRVKLMELMRKA